MHTPLGESVYCDRRRGIHQSKGDTYGRGGDREYTQNERQRGVRAEGLDEEKTYNTQLSFSEPHQKKRNRVCTAHILQSNAKFLPSLSKQPTNLL